MSNQPRNAVLRMLPSQRRLWAGDGSITRPAPRCTNSLRCLLGIRGRSTSELRHRNDLKMRPAWVVSAALAFVLHAPNPAGAQPNTFYTSIRVPPYPTLSYPLRGNAETNIILCRYREDWSGRANPPSGPFVGFMNAMTTTEQTYYNDMFFRRGANGLQDYFHEASRGRFKLSGQVIGWVNLSKSNANGLIDGQPIVDGQQITDCEQGALAAGYASPTRPVFLVVFPPYRSLGDRPWDWAGKVLVSPRIDGFVHEYMHVHGLGHSRSDIAVDYGGFNSQGQQPSYQCDVGTCNEYGNPYDIMSWNRGTMPAPLSRFGGSEGPLFGVASLEALNWLPINEVATFGAGGETDATYELSPLYEPRDGGVRAVRVPFNAGDPDHYYLVEFRTKSGRHRDLDKHRILIYEVKRNINGAVSASVPNSERPRGYLLKDSQSGVAIERLQANGVTIEPIIINGSRATIRVRSQFATRCLMGFVWREATPQDRVCVAGSTRARTRSENRTAASRRNPAGGPFGPDTCLQGYVWRGATVDDRVCVLGSSRDAARADNALASSRVNPARLVAGPNRCASGFVYRQIDPFDYVCVTPARKAQVDSQTALSPAREEFRGVLFSSPFVTCKPNFVLREAFGGDQICVTTAEADAARAESVDAVRRLARR